MSPRLFVATRLEDVPAGLRAYASVDGTVPGARWVWDHHRTGEPTNVGALPERVELDELDGIGTTSADGDAVVSAAVLLLGGRAAVPPGALAVLSSAAHWCDHLAPLPDLDDATNLAGRGLQYAIAEGLRGGAASERFARAARELAGAVREGRPLPFLEGWVDEDARAEALDRAGRIERRGEIALVDLRGAAPVPPSALYRRHPCAVQILVDDHPRGGPRYVVGVNPFGSRASDLRPALERLARAEHACGPPCLAPEPVPGAENWGGRRPVFGSPWNYGSRLSPDDVARAVAEALGLVVAVDLEALWARADRFACSGDEAALPEGPPWAISLARAAADEISFRVAEGRARLEGARASLPDAAARRAARLLELRLDARGGGAPVLAATVEGLRALLAELPPEEAPTRARALHALGATLLSLGDRATAEVALFEALAGIGEGPARAWVLDTAGRALQLTGAWEEARRVLSAVLEQKRALGDRVGVAITAGTVARAETLVGSPARAAELLRAALAETAGAVPSRTSLRLETALLEAELAAGRVDAAAEAASRVRASLAREPPDARHSLIGLAHLALGQLEAARGGSARAEVEQAMAHATAPDQRVWARYCLLRDERPRIAPEDWERELQALAEAADPQTEAAVSLWLALGEARAQRGDAAGRGACFARASACAEVANQPLLVHAVDQAMQRLDPSGYLDRVARRFTGRSGAELEATRRQEATMIFADMVSFTDISQVLEPEQVMSFSRGLFELAVPLLARFSVRPLTYLGDALFAAAEGPEHRARGLAFAYELVARVQRVSAIRCAAGERLVRRGGAPWRLQIRAGVSTGEAVFGVLGNAFKQEYTAIGRKTNLAARLETAARPEEVIVEDLGDEVPPGAAREAVELKGFPEPVAVFRWPVSPDRDHRGRRLP